MTAVYTLILNALFILGNRNVLTLDIANIGFGEKSCIRSGSVDRVKLCGIGNVLETVLQFTGTKRIVVVYDEANRFLGLYQSFVFVYQIDIFFKISCGSVKR